MDNFKCHLNIVKLVNVVVVLLTIVMPIPMDCKVKIDVEPNLKSTTCTYLKHYRLRGLCYSV